MTKQPSTSQELFEALLKLNPELGESMIPKMQRIFEDYKAEQPKDQISKLIKKANQMFKNIQNIELRDVQVMNIIMLTAFPEVGGVLAQIRTGEGKSLIVMVTAAVKALLNSTFVDVFTSSETLAQEDATASKAFFEEMGLSVDHCIDIEKRWREQQEGKEVSKSPLLTANVLYGTVSSFAGLRLRYNMCKSNPKSSTIQLQTQFYESRLKHQSTTSCIVDEVDSMLVDAKSNSTILSCSDCKDRYPELLYLQQHIFKSMSEKILQNEQHQLDSNPEVLPLTNEDIMLSCQAEVWSILQKLKLSNNALEIADSSVTDWVNSCHTALSIHKEQVNYVIKNEGQIKIVDYSNTGETQKSSRWTAGLHRFLEMKHGLKIGNEALSSHVLSNFGCFKQYSGICGLTGTLGTAPTKQFLEKTYNVKSYESPPFKPSSLKVQTPRPVIGNLIEAISKEVEDKHVQGRPVLLINKDIATCKAIQAHLNSTLRLKSPKMKIIEYFDSEIEDKFSRLKTVDCYTVINATNLAGRGTDIKITHDLDEAGGLHVVQSFIPTSERTKQQAEGRAGRSGQNGSACLLWPVGLINEEDCANLILDEKTVSILNNEMTRCQELTEQLNLEAAQFEVEKKLLDDRFYKLFVGLFEKYPKFIESKVLVRELNELYAIRRQKFDKAYQEQYSEIRNKECSAEEKRSLHTTLIAAQEDSIINFINQLNTKIDKSLDKDANLYGINDTLVSIKPEEYIHQVQEALKVDPNNSALKSKLAVAKFTNKSRSEAKALVSEVICQHHEQTVISSIGQKCMKEGAVNVVKIEMTKVLQESLKACDENEALKLKLKKKIAELNQYQARIHDNKRRIEEIHAKVKAGEEQDAQEQAAKEQAIKENDEFDQKSKTLSQSITDDQAKLTQTDQKIDKLQTQLQELDDKLEGLVKSVQSDETPQGEIPTHISNMLILLEIIDKDTKCEAEVQFDLKNHHSTEPVAPIIELKKGYLGYIIGAISILSGLAVGYFAGQFYLAADIMLAGFGMCLQNWEMNENDTYSTKGILIDAVSHAVRIVACSKLDKVFGALDGCEFLTPGMKLALKNVHTFQSKYLEHKSWMGLLAKASGSIAATTKTLFPQPKKPATEHEEQQKACEAAERVKSELGIEARLAEVSQEYLSKRNDTIAKVQVPQAKKKLLNQIKDLLTNLPDGAIFVYYTHSQNANLKHLYENVGKLILENNIKFRSQDLHKLGKVEAKYFEEGFEVEVPTNVNEIWEVVATQLKKQNADQTTGLKLTQFFSDLPDPEAAKKEKEAAEQKIEKITGEWDALNKRLSKGESKAALQSQFDKLQKDYNTANQELYHANMHCLANQKDCQDNFYEFFRRQLNSAITSDTPPELKLEDFERAMKAGTDESMKGLCESLFDAIQKKLAAAFNNSQAASQLLPKDVDGALAIAIRTALIATLKD